MLCAACLHGPPPPFGLLACHIPAPKFRAAFACPLFPQTHQACRMQGSGQTRLAALEPERKAKEKKHSCTGTLRTVQPLCLYSLRGAAAGQLCNRPPPALRTCTVSWLHDARSPCSVQFHHEDQQ